MALRCVDLTPDRWPDLEALFGSNGACGGCWCMSWRIEKGEKWDVVKGDAAKKRLHDGVRSGTILGVLAFDGGEPVGWCTYGPRPSFPKLDRARTLACVDAAEVWSVPCFFVKRGHRGQGVAGALLDHALGAMHQRGVKIAEGYPVRPKGKLPDAFAWVGTLALFEAKGFAIAGDPAASKVRVRRRP